MIVKDHRLLVKTFRLEPNDTDDVPPCPDCRVLPDVVYLHEIHWLSRWWHRVRYRTPVGPTWQWAPCGHTRTLAERPDLMEDGT